MQINNYNIHLVENQILTNCCGLAGTVEGSPMFFIGLNTELFEEAFKSKDIIGAALHVQKLKTGTRCNVVFSLLLDDDDLDSESMNVQLDIGEIAFINKYLELIWQSYATGKATKIVG